MVSSFCSISFLPEMSVIKENSVLGTFTSREWIQWKDHEIFMSCNLESTPGSSSFHCDLGKMRLLTVYKRRNQ